MSASPPRFVIYAPDKTERGTPELRLSVRATHLERAAKAISDGVIRVGGAILTPESLTGPNKVMVSQYVPFVGDVCRRTRKVGSLMIVEAESIEDVRKMVETDIYYTSGVWDPERLVIAPFVAATPFP